MRLALLGLAASLSTLPSLAAVAPDDLRVAQSPVTIVASFTRTGTPATPVTLAGGDLKVTTPIDTVGYGNRLLLRSLLGEDASLAGWSIVAVWANWPEGGNSYKFFARKKGETPVFIPESLLKLEFTDPVAGRKLTLKDGKIIAGSEKHKALAQITLGALGASDDSKRDTFAGIANGIAFGLGNYVRTAGADTAIYRPAREIFKGYGVVDNAGNEAGEQDDILSITLRIGAATSIPLSRFSAVQDGPALPSVPSEGPDAVSDAP